MDHRRVGLESGFAQACCPFFRLVPPDKAAGDAIQLHRVQSQRLADVTESAARAVANHGGGQRGAMPAVFAVDVLDDFFAALVLEIHVDVRRFIALLREEAPEQHPRVAGIHGGDAQGEAHH